ncbi:MAG: hypothetical protein AB7Y46_14730, partial [Armatimonadota bacterium]
MTRALLAVMGCALVATCTGCLAQELSEQQQADLNRLAREWTYVQQRARAAMALVGETAELAAVAESAAQRIAAAAAADVSLLAGWWPLEDPGMRDDLLDAAGLRAPNVAIARALQGEASLLATFTDPWTRHEPTWIPPTEPVHESRLTVLRGEQTAAAFTLSNASDNPIDCALVIEGLDAPDFEVTVRRQVYLETWYGRERSGVYDALPRLPQGEGVWRVTIPPGDSVR